MSPFVDIAAALSQRHPPIGLYMSAGVAIVTPLGVATSATPPFDVVIVTSRRDAHRGRRHHDNDNYSTTA
jgi:hypothetical protein